MDADTSVVLIGDDLADVREALDALQIPFHTSPQTGMRLLITDVAGAARNDRDRTLHVVVADAMHSVACDFLLRRPVSTELLRRLVARAHYGGPERRRATRCAIGSHVTLRSEGETREAILAQVSAGGCGLVLPVPLERDAAITLELPQDLTGPRRSLQLRGRVLGSRELVTGDGATFDVSVRFEELALPDRITLRALMASRGLELRPDMGPDASASTPPRRGVRAAVADTIGKRVVIGRGVSRVAMQLERDPCLRVGDRCKVALYAGADIAPVHVSGQIAEDTEDRGFLLRFEDVSDAVARQLDRLAAVVHEASPRAGFVIAEVEA